jgi:hypothetical protein
MAAASDVPGFGSRAQAVIKSAVATQTNSREVFITFLFLLSIVGLAYERVT